MQGDTPIVLIQTKHQIFNVGNLNDTSVDLWRTKNKKVSAKTAANTLLLNKCTATTLTRGARAAKPPPKTVKCFARNVTAENRQYKAASI